MEPSTIESTARSLFRNKDRIQEFETKLTQNSVQEPRNDKSYLTTDYLSELEIWEKEKNKLQEELNTLKENDKILTNGLTKLLSKHENKILQLEHEEYIYTISSNKIIPNYQQPFAVIDGTHKLEISRKIKTL